MNSWNIIGWIIIAYLAYVTITFLLKKMYILFRHLFTYNIVPEVGQVWWDDEEKQTIEVTDIYNGFLRVKISLSSMPFSFDEWKEYKSKWTIYLIYNEKNINAKSI